MVIRAFLNGSAASSPSRGGNRSSASSSHLRLTSTTPGYPADVPIHPHDTPVNQQMLGAAAAFPAPPLKAWPQLVGVARAEGRRAQWGRARRSTTRVPKLMHESGGEQRHGVVGVAENRRNAEEGLGVVEMGGGDFVRIRR